MRIAEVRKRFFAAPFRPFDIVRTNGRSVPVEHREFMALSPKGRSVTVCEDDGALIIDVPLIVALKERTSGARKRKR
ncbi:MAG: hypothetical protein ACREIF_17370 [Chthoniobacterales bacterium]